MNNTNATTVPNDVYIDEKIQELLASRVSLAKDEIERLARSYIRASTNAVSAQRRGDTEEAGWLNIEAMKVCNELENAKDDLKKLTQSLSEVAQRLASY